MKMEVIPVQSIYGGVLGSNKNRDWTSTLTPPASASVAIDAAVNAAPLKTKGSSARSSDAPNYSIKHKQAPTSHAHNYSKKTKPSSGGYYYAGEVQAEDEEEQAAPADLDMREVSHLSLRFLDELRAAKSRHLTCTEVSLPCDLVPSIAADIVRVSEKEPCGTRGCTIYIEFEDEPKNSRRIASLKLDPETVSSFEVYVTLRQDHRGWTSLLPQFMKSLARTITISPEYTITKNKLYSAEGPGARRSYSFGSSQSRAIATPTV
ncbi:protein scylla [Drosophila subobscura]|uniref:protein scylla n=1 Tax=Drosophila subobscura TaxID=7241 RepID=UPI00155A0699|nr:protein scylla [Drosophila subobscura]